MNNKSKHNLKPGDLIKTQFKYVRNNSEKGENAEIQIRFMLVLQEPTVYSNNNEDFMELLVKENGQTILVILSLDDETWNKIEVYCAEQNNEH